MKFVLIIVSLFLIKTLPAQQNDNINYEQAAINYFVDSIYTIDENYLQVCVVDSDSVADVFGQLKYVDLFACFKDIGMVDSLNAELNWEISVEDNSKEVFLSGLIAIKKYRPVYERTIKIHGARKYENKVYVGLFFNAIEGGFGEIICFEFECGSEVVMNTCESSWTN
ncbi:hypothetical protein KFE94_16755 [bacterium SCSIO 12643]|nr:hypothetical protein KFE94_16755 [bacterium SCSIO 12643]